MSKVVLQWVLSKVQLHKQTCMQQKTSPKTAPLAKATLGTKGSSKQRQRPKYPQAEHHMVDVKIALERYTARFRKVP